MTKKKHTTEECRVRYETSNSYSIADIAEWSGYTTNYLYILASREKWERGCELRKSSIEGLKKQAINNADDLLQFKQETDGDIKENTKQAFGALDRLQLLGKEPTFEELKCRKIVTEIALNSYKLLGFFEDKPSDIDNEIKLVFVGEKSK